MKKFLSTTFESMCIGFGIGCGLAYVFGHEEPVVTGLWSAGSVLVACVAIGLFRKVGGR